MLMKCLHARVTVFCTVLNISCTAGGQMLRSGTFSANSLKVSAASEGGHSNGSHPSGIAEGRSGQEEVRVHNKEGACTATVACDTPF